MREVKFRAWDKDELVMFQPEDIRHINFTEKMIILNTNDYDFIGDFGDDEDGTLILMQYTGLKDKNGKEIFEGDIIKYSEHPTYGSLLEFNSEVKITPFGILIKSYAGNEKFLAKCFKYCEVIGNIYENKELI